jgi:DNA ligase-1
MTLAQFARLMQTIEHRTPTETIRQIAADWDNITDQESLIKILDMDYAMNNIGGKKAIKWVAQALESFEDEVQQYVTVHMDLGEGIYYFVGDNEDSPITLKQFLLLLQMDCGKMSFNTFRHFKENFSRMSKLEKKWFLRYWIRKPRNGINRGTVEKLLANVFGRKVADVKKHCNFNTPAEVLSHYIINEEPDMELSPGIYVAPMLAKVVENRKWPKERIYEYKYDGARYQIHKADNIVMIFNRKGKIVNEQFTDIIEDVQNYTQKKLILDTEIYPITVEGGPAPFKKMGTRIHSKDHEKAMHECPVKLAIFDVLHYEGQTLLDEPLSRRLEYLDLFEDRAIYAKDENYNSFYSRAIAEGFEGIMVKNLNAVYHAGKRSPHWAKHKPPRIELDVVITGARYGEGKRGHVFASFDIAVAHNHQYPDNFYGVGSIGTGFKDADFMRLTNALRPIVENFENETYHVLPRIVLEVTADLVSTNAEGNYGLRFPRLVAIRDDKAVSEIDTFDDLVRMVE